MKKATKRWLNAAAALVAGGLILFAVAAALCRWDLSNLTGTAELKTTSFDITEDFTDITVRADTAILRVAPAKDGVCRVVCILRETLAPTVEVQDGALTVTAENGPTWNDIFNWSFAEQEITVYLPRSDYAALSIRMTTGNVELLGGLAFDTADVTVSTGDVDLRSAVRGEAAIRSTTGDIRVKDTTVEALDLTTTTGDIIVERATVGSLDLTTTTGDVATTKVTCDRLSSNGSTGDIDLKDVAVAETLSIERSTGDVTLYDTDAAEIAVKTTTGDVTGTLSSEKTFITKTSTGEVSVPQTTGGRCEITTTTGDIRFTAKK